MNSKILEDYGFKMVARCGIIYYACGNYTIEELVEEGKLEVCHGDLECEYVDTLDEALELIAQWEEYWED